MDGSDFYNIILFLKYIDFKQALNTERIIPGSYMVAMIPYLGMVMDGAENWVAAMNQVSPGTLDMPTFTSEEKSFYQEARGSIKLGMVENFV